MSQVPQIVDHLVIGGGPAGAMLSLRLAAAGRRVALLEKEPGPHDKVCGEFLSREAIEYLQQAGISPRELGAVAINTLRLSSSSKVVHTTLPFPALSLSRRILDAALLERAEESGCEVFRGLAVEALNRDGDKWIATLSDGKSVRSAQVFLANGKHDLRGWSRPEGRQSDLVGFKMHWQLASGQVETLRECMHLFLFRGGYGGLSLIENDSANLCLVVRRSTIRRLGAWPQILAAILGENRLLCRALEGGSPLWTRPFAISPIPYGYLAAESRGPWCIGDQAAVIPSFTGDGISIALHSAALAAQMFLAGQSAAEYHRALHMQLRRSMTLATVFTQAAVTHVGRSIAIPALSLLPDAMRWVAATTRIAHAFLLLEEGAGPRSGRPARQTG